MSKKLKNIPLLDQAALDNVFKESCSNGDLSAVKYMLNSKKLFISPDFHCIHSGLMLACLNGHLNIVEYLMYSKDLEKNMKFNDRDYGYLDLMCKSKHFHVVDFLFRNKIFEPQRAFVEYHANLEEPTPLSHYLIENCNVPINISVQAIINRNPLISKIFVNRDLQKELKNNVDSNTNKKFKL